MFFTFNDISIDVSLWKNEQKSQRSDDDEKLGEEEKEEDQTEKNELNNLIK